MKPLVIIFDLGNVVLTNDHAFHSPEEIKQFCDYFKVTLDNLETAFTVAFPDYSLGKCTEEEFWQKYLFTARANNINIEFAKSFWRKHQKENETMLSLLDRLRKSYRLACLSTIPKEWLKFKRKKFNLDYYFETIISSGEVGVKKPDPKIYKIIIDKLNLPPEKLLFIDDTEITLPPAQEFGMKTVLFRGQEALEQELAKHK